MALKTKSETKKANSAKQTKKVTDEVGSYEKHPFFVKKANAAKSLLQKVGLPKGLTKKSLA